MNYFGRKESGNYAGLLGGLLPWLALFSAWLYGKMTGGLTQGFWSDLVNFCDLLLLSRPCRCAYVSFNRSYVL